MSDQPCCEQLIHLLRSAEPYTMGGYSVHGCRCRLALWRGDAGPEVFYFCNLMLRDVGPARVKRRAL